MNPLVSVIIPTYNRRAFLVEAVESVRAQDYRPLEVIVVDDGSTDDTKKALSAFSTVTYINQTNLGPSAARNRGIACAQGAFITFLDSDDLWLPTKLSVQIALMEKNPGPAVIYTDEIWMRKGVQVNPGKIHKKYSGWIYPRCLPLCIISPSSVMIRREVFDHLGTFDENLMVCEDYDLWLRISARFSVLFIDQKLIIKRGGHDDQLSRRFWGNDRFRVRALQKTIGDEALSPENRALAIKELVRKATILEQGFRKRNKTFAADYYRRLIEEYVL